MFTFSRHATSSCQSRSCRCQGLTACAYRDGCANELILHCSLQTATGRMFVQAREKGNPHNVQALGLLVSKYVQPENGKGPSWEGGHHARALRRPRFSAQRGPSMSASSYSSASCPSLARKGVSDSQSVMPHPCMCRCHAARGGTEGQLLGAHCSATCAGGRPWTTGDAWPALASLCRAGQADTDPHSGLLAEDKRALALYTRNCDGLVCPWSHQSRLLSNHADQGTDKHVCTRQALRGPSCCCACHFCICCRGLGAPGTDKDLTATGSLHPPFLQPRYQMTSQCS